LISVLEGSTNRKARFRTAIALVAPSSAEVVVEGVLEGVILSERRGSGGFGYDPIFEVDGVTLAEMPPATKNAISHRAVALALLADHFA
jgi:XTP/dITP diphosphohydrolase